jgi:DNA-binding transcriptional regulator GbsR (MarR family)
VSDRSAARATAEPTRRRRPRTKPAASTQTRSREPTKSPRAVEPTDPPNDRAKLREPELLVSDAIGKLIEFWGFKRNMGRAWTVLYLSPHPLTAADLRERLQISSCAVSMTLTELAHWGVVKKVWVQGERRDYFACEIVLWRMISRVLGERERVEIGVAIESFERAIEHLKEMRKHDAAGKSLAEFQMRRVRGLLELARMGSSLLDALLSTAKLDAGPLTRLLLGEQA